MGIDPQEIDAAEAKVRQDVRDAAEKVGIDPQEIDAAEKRATQLEADMQCCDAAPRSLEDWATADAGDGFGEE